VYNKSRNYSNYDNILPITDETLSVMPDDELKKLFIYLRSFINKNKRNRKFSKEKEEDFCYVQRELQLRKFARQKSKN